MSFPKYRAAGIIDGADWDDFVLNMVAHSLRHVLAGVDPIITPLDARAIALTAQGDIVYLSGVANTLARLAPGVAGQALLTGGAGADPSWGAPAPAAHVLATTGPHTNELPLTDLAAGVQGNIISRTAADWVALAVGVAGQALLSGGPAADVSWGAPAPAAHSATHEPAGADEVNDIDIGNTGVLLSAHEARHVSGGADDIDSTLDGRAIALTTQGDVVYASGVNTITRLGAGTVGQVLVTGGAGANPFWGNPAGTPIFIAAPSPDGYTGRHAGQRLTDGVDVLVRMDFVLPYRFDITTWGVDVLIIPEGNGDMRRSVATDFGLICAGEQKDANSDTIAAGEVAVTLDEIECIDITGALAGSTALDLVGLEFTREGSHGNDTVDADCYFIGVVIRPP